MRVFIDSALAGEALRTLTTTALMFIGIALFQQVIAVGVTYLGENVAWTATNALRAELAWQALNLDMRFHNDHTPGELIERIDGDVTELATFLLTVCAESREQRTVAGWYPGCALSRRLARRAGIYNILLCHHHCPGAAQGYRGAAPKGTPRS